MFAVEQPAEKALGEILGVGRSVALPPHKSIEWIPICAAKLLQRQDRLSRLGLGRLDDEAPVRGSKLRVPERGRRDQILWWVHIHWLSLAPRRNCGDAFRRRFLAVTMQSDRARLLDLFARELRCSRKNLLRNRFPPNYIVTA